MNGKNLRFDVIGQLAVLRRYARSLTRSDADAEDLVHDALVRAYERKSTFRQAGNLRTWLLSVLHNVFVDGYRSRHSATGRLEQAAVLAEAHLLPPQDHVVRLSQIRTAFLSLAEEQRAALHLVAIEGLSYDEAAATLAIPVGTLMSRIARARAALREIEDGPAATEISHLKIVGGRNDKAN
ncbi:sigma-70 family RNA polymerase sigma factor [Allomesorhizobium camelthorni]|uniref:Sigma-70 family RNA polymerase sigma factor n=1 Tax=Allomesorhizobium camelthorni TaxID=475069 RepID=A0A6G4WLL2_9HYPH|nr:sigma-70 family RNA polymerase sigma factor [Mesorhizobium camelthorni]NGO55073.1 sigma-70 family RNA polymerase sigma factor [Mesorhizobium camelthorni]